MKYQGHHKGPEELSPPLEGLHNLKHLLAFRAVKSNQKLWHTPHHSIKFCMKLMTSILAPWWPTACPNHPEQCLCHTHCSLFKCTTSVLPGLNNLLFAPLYCPDMEQPKPELPEPQIPQAGGCCSSSQVPSLFLYWGYSTLKKSLATGGKKSLFHSLKLTRAPLNAHCTVSIFHTPWSLTMTRGDTAVVMT